jgi:Sap, sulfolipid-1-addressing protein
VAAAIGQALPFAVAVALSAGAIILEVLMLLTRRGRINGPSFLVGRSLGIAAVGAILLAIASPSGASDRGQPATWVDWLELILGAGLLVVAAQQWQARPTEDEPAQIPKWMGALDAFTPLKAAGIGLALVFLNLKNLLLMVGGAAAVAQTGISAGRQVVAWTVFTLIASIGVAAPVAIYFAMGTRATSTLDRLRDWMARNNTVITAVICLLFGAKLVGDALTGFST